MMGSMSRRERQAYWSFFSYRRVYDLVSVGAVAAIFTVWLFIIRGNTFALGVIFLVFGIASENWGREAMWRRLPSQVRELLPKEPLDAKGAPGAIRGYRDLYRAWVGTSPRDTGR
jgi:hypothetical protein